MTTSWVLFGAGPGGDWCFICGHLAGYCEHSPAETRLAEMESAWEYHENAWDVSTPGWPESFYNIECAWREREGDLRLDAEEKEFQIEAAWMGLDWDDHDDREWWRENHHWIDEQLAEEEDALEFLGYGTDPL